jgi:hypothetical protein
MDLGPSCKSRIGGTKIGRDKEGCCFALGVASASPSSAMILPTPPNLAVDLLGPCKADIEEVPDADREFGGRGLNIGIGSSAGVLVLGGADWIPGDDRPLEVPRRDAGLCVFILVVGALMLAAESPPTETDPEANGWPRGRLRRDNEEDGRDIAERGRGLGLGLGGASSSVVVVSPSLLMTVPNRIPPVD